MRRDGLFGIFARLVLVLLIVLLASCARVTTTTYDKQGNVVEKTEEHGTFESENLGNYYALQARHSDNWKVTTERKIEAIEAQDAKADYQTPTERNLAATLNKLLIAGMEYRPLPIEPPRTMADQNWVDWGRLFLEGYRTFGGDGYGKRTGSPNLEITGTGNNLIFDSELGTGEHSMARFWFGEYSNYEVESSGESSLSFNASRPYTNTETRTDTRTTTITQQDVTEDNDSSLF